MIKKFKLRVLTYLRNIYARIICPQVCFFCGEERERVFRCAANVYKKKLPSLFYSGLKILKSFVHLAEKF